MLRWDWRGRRRRLNLGWLGLRADLGRRVSEFAGREPPGNLMAAFRSQVHELHARNFVDLAHPDDTTLNSNGSLLEIDHFKAESLPGLWKAGKLKGYSVFADVDQPAPAILAEENQHHLRKYLPREETPVAGVGNGISHSNVVPTPSGRGGPCHFAPSG